MKCAPASCKGFRCLPYNSSTRRSSTDRRLPPARLLIPYSTCPQSPRPVLKPDSVLTSDDSAPSNISVAGESAIQLAPPQAEESKSGGWWFWAAADNLRLPASNAVKLAEKASRMKSRITILFAAIPPPLLDADITLLAAAMRFPKPFTSSPFPRWKTKPPAIASNRS